jgi:hypothetical protein
VPTLKRPQIDDVQYSSIPSRILKGASKRTLMSPRGGVDGVFWNTKHVHYTLVWI